MAEAIAAIALVASITTLVDFSHKIVSRVKDCAAQATDVPKTFRSLADRIPLLVKALQQIQARAQAGYMSSDVAKELDVLVNSILEQVNIIQQCLDHVTPAAGTSRFDRILNGLKSLAKDEKVQQAVEKIQHGIDVLVLHQTTTTVDVSDRILEELRRLNLQNPPSQQNAPKLAAQQAFGLCLGQAPLIESDAFIGRQAELQQLHEWLSRSQNAQVRRVVSITGMGGLGKTQLSLAYAREYGGQYSSVFWLDAKDVTSLRQSMSALTAVIFSLSTVAAANADEESTNIDKVRRWLSEAWNDQWLIVFDNYDDPSLPNIRSQTGYDIRQFFPTREQGSILITTRSSKLAFSKPLKLQKLDDIDKCISILSQRSGREMTEDQDSRQLALRLDGLPLALTVAGTYLAQIDASCAEYLNLYETAWNDLHGADAEQLMEYEDRTLSSTWTISLDQIRGQDADAAELLQFFGYLDNEDIWYELIRAGADKGPKWIGRLTANKIRFDRAMSKLVDYSLVEVKDGLYRIHPCLHDWIFEQLNASLSEPLFFTAIACLKTSIPDTLHPQYLIMSRRLVKHINRIQHQRFAVLWDTGACDEVILDASHSFGDLFRKLCQLDKAEEMYSRALAGKEKTLGTDHTSTLNTVNNFGLLYLDQDKRDKAEAMYKRALSGYEEALGPDHASTLLAVKNLGTLYNDIPRKRDEAEKMYTRALAGYENTLGSDHTSTLLAFSDLANLYRTQHKLDKAEELYLRALTGYEKVLGLHHTRTLSTVNNLGLLYLRQDKLDEAEAMCMRAFTGYENALGSDHTSTLLAVNNLANLYHVQGKLDEAEAMYKRALTGYEKTLGSDHTSTLLVLSNLGNLYQIQRKLDEGESMYVRTLAGFEKVLEPDHASTLLVVNNLGALYHRQGKLNKAEAMYLRVLAGYEKVPGPDDSLVLRTVNNLGILYRDQGMLDKAQEKYARALARREKALGPDHTETLDTVHNLAELYREQGMLDEAQEKYTRALAGREKVLGPDHTSTLDSIHSLGELYSDQGKPVEAEEMYTRALTGYEKALGLDHTSTLCAVHNLGSLYRDQGKLVNAEERYVRALAGFEKALGKDHYSTLIVSIPLGSLYALQGKVEGAQRLFSHALTVYAKIIGSSDVPHQATIRGYAEVLSKSIRLVGLVHSSMLVHLNNLVSCFEGRGFGDIVVTQWLAKTLVNLEDDENARLAFFHSISKHSEVLDVGGTRCRGCHRRLTAHLGLHVCRQCSDINLCDSCMSAYATSNLTVPTCSDHKFCAFSEVVRQAFKPSTTRNESERDAWLQELKKKYQLNADKQADV